MFQRFAGYRAVKRELPARGIGARSRSIALFAMLLCEALFFTSIGIRAAGATPSLVIDQDTGAVISAQDATEPWYPASLTKLMTAYVVLDEIRAGRLAPDSLVVVSANAASQAPSKMGFRPGTVLTVDNALKMLLVKSANDIAVALAESVGGSVEGFAEMMNISAKRLGMADSYFMNPNGLPNLSHHSSAQDLAILARALLTEFPEHRDYFGIGAISLNGHVYHTYNGLLGRYAGADGMKTGFICAGGFNTVVSAQRGGRRLIAVVLGQPSASVRSVVTAALLDKGFASSTWGRSASLTDLVRVGGAPPDMHGQICGRHGRRRAVTWEQEADVEVAPCGAQPSTNNVALETLLHRSGSCADAAKTASPMTPIAFDPEPVFIGPSAGSANAVEPPGTLAALAANPAAAAKAGLTPGALPDSAAAFAPSAGAESDAISGKLKRDVAPVRLHSDVASKTVEKPSAKAALVKKGRKLSAKSKRAEHVKKGHEAGAAGSAKGSAGKTKNH
ncbi:MAG: D-alanyl-D-alanine carboxypeptidase, partial [Hyphomicrobiales bacterium]|nr:D-alanyl-D-alanine carboxypeptidase [Hyphomicrobiales bacterium]